MGTMLRWALLSIAISATGCVTVNESMLPKSPLPAPVANAPVIETHTGTLVQTLNGSGENRGVLSGETVVSSMTTAICNRWKRHDLISDYDSPGDLDRPADYSLTVSGKRNEDSSIAGAILSGLLLMIPPTSSTLTYDLQFDLTNKRTGQAYHTAAKNAVTSYMEILLLPALPFSWMGSMHMQDDIADYVYNEFRKQGAFTGPEKASALPLQ